MMTGPGHQHLPRRHRRDRGHRSRARRRRPPRRHRRLRRRPHPLDPVHPHPPRPLAGRRRPEGAHRRRGAGLRRPRRPRGRPRARRRRHASRRPSSACARSTRPGHASNHLCFLLEQERLLFSGDHIMQGSTVVISPPDGDMARTSRRSSGCAAAAQLKAIAPGHGVLIDDPQAKLDEYLDHRLARERQVAEALRKPPAGHPEELVDADLHRRARGPAPGRPLLRLGPPPQAGRRGRGGGRRSDDLDATWCPAAEPTDRSVGSRRHAHEADVRTVPVLGVAALSVVLLVACQPDPTGGHRPPPPVHSVVPFGGTIGRPPGRTSGSRGGRAARRLARPVGRAGVVLGVRWERHRGAIVVHDSAAPGIRDVFGASTASGSRSSASAGSTSTTPTTTRRWRPTTPRPSTAGRWRARRPGRCTPTARPST